MYIKSLPQPVKEVEVIGPNGHVRPLAEIEADVISNGFIVCKGRISDLARQIQISRSKLYRWIEHQPQTFDLAKAVASSVAADRD